MDWDQLTQRFDLGAPEGEPVRVSGGLSNELWRLTTTTGAFAIKRMVVNAGNPDFRNNVEASYQVERHAFAAGVPMPEPIPDALHGTALTEVDGALFRAHRWTDGVPTTAGDSPVDLLARIHAAGHPRQAPAPKFTWQAHRWGLTELAKRVSDGPGHLLTVDSHRDLDRKNTLRTPDGTLLALDWDAAGPIPAVHEAVAVALDWSDGNPETFHGYAVPAEPWVFAGWVQAQGDWLDYNATHRAGSPLGAAEVTATLARLRTLADTMDDLLRGLRSAARAARPRPA